MDKKHNIKEGKNVLQKGKTFEGNVVSTKMANTVVVNVEHMHKHPLYRKAVRRAKKFAVHNELPDIKVGDTVTIVEIKPMSKTKHFLLTGKIR